MTARQEQILDMLMQGKSQSKIAQDLGVSKQAVSQTIHTDNFQSELQKRKQAAIQSGLLRLQNNFAAASAVVLQIAADKDVPPQTRLNAAQVAMSQCRTWTETADILQRLDALEAAAEENKH